jgi:non-specific serine/threonine protein kinase
VVLLAQALGLAADETALLEASIVRGRVPAVAAPAHGRQDRATPPEPTIGGDAAPVVHASQPARTNLPLALTSFIGREREQAAVQALLGTARLVTLTGAGGAGKTRLALAVAGEVLGEYCNGVWLVELAPLADPALVAGAVAQVLGLREEVHRSLLTTLVDHLKEQQLLLVLDNCEHLVPTCAELARALLEACPHLRILATSREGLDVPGEHLYRVPSLPVPELDRLPALEELSEYAAVALFLARAQERRVDFKLTAQNARAVAQICARLDGMPLAIELAAARAASLPVEAIAIRLDDRFRLLTSGPRTAVPRQQTLRATLDWSYDLLELAEQRLLARLSVFAGGWALEAAEAVCSGDAVEARAVLDSLGSLVNKSLVLLEYTGPGREQGRYRLLETVRQYGRERLESREEATVVRERHATYYLTLAVEAEPHLTGQEQWPWRVRLGAEQDNLRAALRWFLERGAADESLQLVVVLDTFWMAREGYVEGMVGLERALALPGMVSPRARARALVRLGWGRMGRGDTHTSCQLLEEAWTLGSGLEDRPTMARALLGLGMLAIHQGDYPRACAVLEESLLLYRPLGDWWGHGVALCHLARVVNLEGDHAQAHMLLDDALALAGHSGEHQVGAMVLEVQGEVAFALEDYAAAGRLWEESLHRHHQLGLSLGVAAVENFLGLLALRLGDYATARTHYCASLEHQWGWVYWAICSLAGMAAVAAAGGQAERALRLAGAATALGEAAALQLPVPEQAVLGSAIEAARATLDERTAMAAWVAGRAMTLAEAVTEARGAES